MCQSAQTQTERLVRVSGTVERICWITLEALDVTEEGSDFVYDGCESMLVGSSESLGSSGFLGTSGSWDRLGS